MQKENSPYWEVPYLPIDPADLGRQYEPIIRINSQSGKGGAAFVMHQSFGYILPKAMHPEFGKLVKKACDQAGREISTQEVFDIFKGEYLEVTKPYHLLTYKIFEEDGGQGQVIVDFEGTIRHHGETKAVSGKGNGPIDAFFNAIQGEKIDRFTFLDYASHAITDGSDSQGVAYILLQDQRTGKQYWGVGLSHNINLAPLRAILSAVNRSKKHEA